MKKPSYLVPVLLALFALTALLIANRREQAHPLSAILSGGGTPVSAPDNRVAPGAARLAAGETNDRSAGHPASIEAQEPPEPTMVGRVVHTDSQGRETAEIASDRRILLAPNERVVVGLNRAMFDATAPIVLRADNGGSINDQPLQPQVVLPASAAANSFAFRAGGDRGLYTVTVGQGRNAETLEFWVGSASPRGEPGPAREFGSAAHALVDAR